MLADRKKAELLIEHNIYGNVTKCHNTIIQNIKHKHGHSLILPPPIRECFTRCLSVCAFVCLSGC